jgi:hypothetical protein
MTDYDTFDGEEPGEPDDRESDEDSLKRIRPLDPPKQVGPRIKRNPRARLSITLPSVINEEIRRIADVTDKSYSEVITILIRDGLHVRERMTLKKDESYNPRDFL